MVLFLLHVWLSFFNLTKNFSVNILSSIFRSILHHYFLHLPKNSEILWCQTFMAITEHLLIQFPAQFGWAGRWVWNKIFLPPQSRDPPMFSFTHPVTSSPGGGTIRVMPQLPETYPDELSISAQTMDPTGSLSMTPDN